MILVKKPLVTEGRIAEDDIKISGNNIGVLVASGNDFRFRIEVFGDLRRNRIAFNRSKLCFPFRRTKAEKIPYSCGRFQNLERGCVFAFADAETRKPLVDAANDGFRSIMGILRGTSSLRVLIAGEQRLDFVVLFPPAFVFGIKGLRQAAPAHIAHQRFLLFRACHFGVVPDQALKDGNGPDIVLKFDGGASTAEFVGGGYAVVSSLVSTPISSRISQFDMPLMRICIPSSLHSACSSIAS